MMDYLARKMMYVFTETLGPLLLGLREDTRTMGMNGKGLEEIKGV